MADWNTPTLSTAYATFLTNISDRLVDSATLFASAPTNPPNAAKRWNGSTNLFESYSTGSSTWSAIILAIAGGGTGSSTASGARTNLGLGSIATQASDNVTITGGAISGLSSFSLSGALTAGGKITTTSAAADSIKTSGGITAGGTVPIINTSGKIPAISSTYFADLDGSNLTGLGSNTWSGLTGTPPAVSIFSNDAAYLTAATLGSAMATYLGAFTADIIPSTDASRAIGSAAKSVNAFYVYDIYPKLPYTTTDFCDPVVQDNTSDRRLYAKTNGLTSTPADLIAGMTIQKGIVTSVTLMGAGDFSYSGASLGITNISISKGVITAITLG
jgi:hypothetical protein